MEVISIVAMILLTLLGFCAGITLKAGKSAIVQPGLIDLILVLILWIIIIILRLSLDINHWLYLVIGLGLGVVTGYLSAVPRQFNLQPALAPQPSGDVSANAVTRTWQTWTAFSKRLGHVQTRIFLAYFYLILVAPVAVMVRLFSDPLSIGKQKPESQWTMTDESENDTDQFRRQF